MGKKSDHDTNLCPHHFLLVYLLSRLFFFKLLLMQSIESRLKVHHRRLTERGLSDVVKKLRSPGRWYLRLSNLFTIILKSQINFYAHTFIFFSGKTPTLLCSVTTRWVHVFGTVQSPDEITSVSLQIWSVCVFLRCSNSWQTWRNKGRRAGRARAALGSRT